ncbi:WNT8A [Branchiostoma lanceolatum]|uniref:Protein Wnt n=1 Tax=Branchiostoma lanceolatum TaxID=7740 RepID=A0A8J9Z3R8_BRALA|nr:WNT8A [Branchiostoma lanceolatum]
MLFARVLWSMSVLFAVLSRTVESNGTLQSNFLIAGPKSSFQASLTYASSVAAGAQTAMEECKYQFSLDRWNCTDNALSMLKPNTLPDQPSESLDGITDESAPVMWSGSMRDNGNYLGANRETSFVHAISAAGVMYVLTRNCSKGAFEQCGCDQTNNGKKAEGGWTWGGCSDDISFGESISKRYSDGVENGQDARAAMNLHNNDVGRKAMPVGDVAPAEPRIHKFVRAVRQTMKRVCKCHGVSGSCTTKTCWLQLADFRAIGVFLKKKYKKADKVDYVRGQLTENNSASSKRNTGLKKDMVFLEDSPDYCRQNLTVGSRGTLGRECLRGGKNLDKYEKKSCKRLCKDCGYVPKRITTEVTSSCNCKFHWCCSVKCSQCTKTVTKYICVQRESKNRRKNVRKKSKQRRRNNLRGNNN